MSSLKNYLKKIEFLRKTKYLLTIFDTSVSQENIILQEYFPFKDKIFVEKKTIKLRRFKSRDPRFLKLRVRSDDFLILVEQFSSKISKCLTKWSDNFRFELDYVN